MKSFGMGGKGHWGWMGKVTGNRWERSLRIGGKGQWGWVGKVIGDGWERKDHCGLAGKVIEDGWEVIEGWVGNHWGMGGKSHWDGQNSINSILVKLYCSNV